MEYAQKKILLVDDEESIRFYLGTVLERSGYRILTAATGKEALALAKKEMPHLIILDIMLPDMSGGDVAAALSQRFSTTSIPVIFLTGVITKTEETAGLKTGKHYVLAKPVTIDDLLKTIKLALTL